MVQGGQWFKEAWLKEASGSRRPMVQGGQWFKESSFREASGLGRPMNTARGELTVVPGKIYCLQCLKLAY